MCAAESAEVGVFGESQFSDATVELFSCLSCFQGVGSGVCRNKKGRGYSDFTNIKMIGKKMNQRDGLGAERRNNGLEST